MGKSLVTSIKRSRRPIAIFLLGQALGALLWQQVSPVAGAVIIGIGLFVGSILLFPMPWTFLGIWRAEHETRFSRSLPVLHIVLTFVIVFIPFFVFRESLVGGDVNAIARYSTEPEYHARVGQLDHALIVEFAVNEYLVKGIDIEIDTGAEYNVESVQKWFNAPRETDRPRPYEGTSTIGRDFGEVEKDPPVYRYRNPEYEITRDRSLYIYFESSAPMRVASVTLNGETLSLSRIEE